MSQPARWLWGLVPLALLWGFGNLLLDARVEQDVARRAEAAVETAAGATPGPRPAFAQVVGRDVTISGEVLSADGAAKAMTRLRSEAGIRRVLGGLSQVVAQKPYSWFASRQPGAITLGGFVPDAETADANVAAAREALPGFKIDDRQSVAFGAPEGFAAIVKSIIAALPMIETGRISLDDRRVCVEGTARSADNYLSLTEGQVAPGFGILDCDLRPPVITPYRWSLERAATGTVKIRGFYPDRDTRERLLAAVRASFSPPASVEDGMKPGAGAPSAFLLKAARAARDLARLSEGTAAIEGDVYTLSGRGPDDHAACEALRVQIAQQDGPDSVARVAIDCPPAPPPDPEIPPLPEVPGLILNDVVAQAVPVRSYELSLSADRSGVRITGSLPDEAARAMLRAVIADSPLAGKVEDEAVAAPGAPAGFIEAARVVLADLLRLDIGSATIRDREVSLRGLTCRDLIASEVETSEKIGLPPDFTASVSVSPRQTGCVLDPPASCQNDLDGLTKENPVLFAQGTAAVKLDPTTERVIAAAAAILQKCPGAQVMIEGHANRDGEWRAFDNRELSLRRAQRVREELARRGIDPASLVVKGYGTARPLLPHGAPQAREMNRRVQFTIAK